MRVTDLEGRLLCSKCGEYKWATEFYRRGIGTNELQYWCKECMKASSRRRNKGAQERAKLIMNAQAHLQSSIQLAHYKAGLTPPESAVYGEQMSAIDRCFELGYDVSDMSMADARKVADEIHTAAMTYSIDQMLEDEVEIEMPDPEEWKAKIRAAKIQRYREKFGQDPPPNLIR